MIDASILLAVLFLFFTTIAFIFREAFLFSISAFLSIIFGVFLALGFTGEDPNLWAFQIIGFTFILFGVWLLIASIEFNLNKGGK
jgi:hypothetical protein